MTIVLNILFISFMAIFFFGTIGANDKETRATMGLYTFIMAILLIIHNAVN